MEITNQERKMTDRAKTCCFTGHRPEKLVRTEMEVMIGLRQAIEQAIADGENDPLLTNWIEMLNQSIDACNVAMN